MTTTDRGTRKGVLISVSASMLELLSDRRKVAVSLAEISKVEIERRDSVANGIRNGLLAGAASGAMLGIFAVASDCGQQAFLNFCSPSGFAAVGSLLALWGGGIGSIAGWVVDASTHERRVVYRAAQSVSVSVAPQISAGSAGIWLVARW